MQTATRKKVKEASELFPFGDKTRLREMFCFGDEQLKVVRAKLPSPIYHFQVSRKIYYNLKLVQHYFLVGSGSEHDRLKEQYLATLPKVS